MSQHPGADLGCPGATGTPRRCIGPHAVHVWRPWIRRVRRKCCDPRRARMRLSPPDSGSVTRSPLAERVSPVMKLDSSPRRKVMMAAISSGWPIRPWELGTTRCIVSSGRTWAISVSMRPGADAVDADIIGGERLGAASGHRDDARLGRGVMDLHLPQAGSSRRRGYQDDPAEPPRDHLVLDREDDQERPVQVHVDRLEPALGRSAPMVADVADRTAMGEQVDRTQLVPRPRRPGDRRHPAWRRRRVRRSALRPIARISESHVLGLFDREAKLMATSAPRRPAARPRPGRCRAIRPSRGPLGSRKHPA